MHVAGEVKMQQLHNYAYSRSHGLATTHFILSQNAVHDDFKGSETWLMLESLEAALEDTLTEYHKSPKLDVRRVLVHSGTAFEEPRYANKPAGLRCGANEEERWPMLSPKCVPATSNVPA